MSMNADLNNPTVLVVDDEPFFRTVIRDILEKESYEIIEASSGKEVESLISQYPVSAVLTDIEMPDMSGLAVLQLVKQLQPDLPVMIVSSHRDFAAARQVLKSGALDYLVKPIEDSELTAAVQRAVTVYAKSVDARRHREESERRLADLVLLREVGETTSGEADIDSLLERILDFVTEAVKVETASLMLAEDETALILKASRGLPDKVVAGTRVTIADSVAGHVFQTGEPVLLVDMEEDGRFVQSGDTGQYSTSSALSLPLKVRDRVIGVLNVNNKRDGATFTATDQYLLASMAHQATMAIENLDLVNRLKGEARRLDALNKVRSRLVCNLSHELRTPLTTVIGFADLLLTHRDMIDETDLLDYLGKIQDGSLKMERLISEMMLLFTLDSGTAVWHLEPIELADLCNEVLLGVSEQIETNKLSLNLWVDEALPELVTDVEKLRAVFEAMIDNAIKFNRPGGLISIAAGLMADEPGMFSLRIYNDGVRIPAEAVDEIFLPYSQLGELNTDKPTGVGIGLTLCKTVIEALGGQIRLDESGEEGAAFSIVLPLKSEIKQEGTLP